MSMDSGNLQKPEKRDPPTSDLEDLRKKIDVLGRGDIAHKMINLLGNLVLITVRAKKGGWTDDLRTLWDKEVAEINRRIAEAKVAKAEDEAREKRLI